MNLFNKIEHFFIAPEKTQSGYSFMDVPDRISFDDAEAILYGIPLDITTSFGKGTRSGPKVIRITSAKQIETFLLDNNTEIYDKLKIFDLGDFILPDLKKKNLDEIFEKMSKEIAGINLQIRDNNKIPIVLGGEHTISYFTIKAIAKETPVILHFDAHRDMKPTYDRMKLCHTTPFYHLIKNKIIKGSNLIQIGIRQADREENDIAKMNGVTTFDAWEIHNNFEEVKQNLRKITYIKKIYISLDIDVYDICYVPCTGTPEPFGLNPFQLVEIIDSINNNSKLVGLEIVEVAMKNEDYREGTLATQTIYGIISRLINKNNKNIK
ncbi:MAG: agmatinase [Nitrososphaeraceae archaeon]|nr:agmatinase [Nitrososphaeraceae archaeon]